MLRGSFGPIAECDAYKPQWAYKTPEGFRDEPYTLPFLFTVSGSGLVPATDLPLQLDDDVPFIVRGIYFPQIGTATGLTGQIPAVCRIRDSHGYSLSQNGGPGFQTLASDLILALGAYCLTGTDGGAFGFPIEPEVICEPGGTLLFDFLVSTNAAVASFSGEGTITFLANTFGTAGNVVSIEIINGAGVSVSVIGSAVQFTVIIGVTTVAELQAALLASPAASAIIQASYLPSSGGALVGLVAVNLLTGGAASASDVTIVGSVLGVKRFKEC